MTLGGDEEFEYFRRLRRLKPATARPASRREPAKRVKVHSPGRQPWDARVPRSFSLFEPAKQVAGPPRRVLPPPSGAGRRVSPRYPRADALGYEPPPLRGGQPEPRPPEKFLDGPKTGGDDTISTDRSNNVPTTWRVPRSGPRAFALTKATGGRHRRDSFSAAVGINRQDPSSARIDLTKQTAERLVNVENPNSTRIGPLKPTPEERTRAPSRASRDRVAGSSVLADWSENSRRVWKTTGRRPVGESVFTLPRIIFTLKITLFPPIRKLT